MTLSPISPSLFKRYSPSSPHSPNPFMSPSPLLDRLATPYLRSPRTCSGDVLQDRISLLHRAGTLTPTTIQELLSGVSKNIAYLTLLAFFQDGQNPSNASAAECFGTLLRELTHPYFHPNKAAGTRQTLSLFLSSVQLLFQRHDNKSNCRPLSRTLIECLLFKTNHSKSLLQEASPVDRNVLNYIAFSFQSIPDESWPDKGLYHSLFLEIISSS